MMPAILKPGRPPQLDKPWNRIFVCQKCGCEFGLVFGEDAAPKYTQPEDRPMGDSGYWETACPSRFGERACTGTAIAYDTPSARTWSPPAAVAERFTTAYTRAVKNVEDYSRK